MASPAGGTRVHPVNRKRVWARLMRLMGWWRSISAKHEEAAGAHNGYPICSAGNLDRTGQTRSGDRTSPIPDARAFSIWSRSWTGTAEAVLGLSACSKHNSAPTLRRGHCQEAVGTAMASRTEIFNTDQSLPQRRMGVPVTGTEFTGARASVAGLRSAWMAKALHGQHLP